METHILAIGQFRNFFLAAACVSIAVATAAGDADAQMLSLSFEDTPEPGKIYHADRCRKFRDGPDAHPCVKYVEGRHGKAIQFGKKSLVAIPLDIDPRKHPQLTIMAWIKRPPGGGNQGFIVSDSGVGGLPYLGLYGGSVSARAGYELIRNPVELEVVPREEWVLLAGVWDFAKRTFRVHTGEAHQTYTDMPMDPARDAGNVVDPLPTFVAPDSDDGVAGRFIFIGSQDFENYAETVSKVAIDEVRIYARSLSVDEINTVASGGAYPE
jgi:hypothetical protein